jgi:ribosomal protein S18 acetylase RimI-like enzyme
MATRPEPTLIRPLRRHDVPNFLPLILQGIGEFERKTGLDRSAGEMVNMLSRRSIWFVLGILRAFRRSPVEVFVAVDGSRFAGTGTLLFSRNTGYVAGMVTAPECRGRGIATRVLSVLQETSVRRKKPWLVLDVDSDNVGASRVYERAGYREVARTAFYTRTGLPPTGARKPPSPSSGRELEPLLTGLDSGREKDFRAAFPATVRTLTHNEILVSGRNTRKVTWVHGSAPSSPIVLRAVFSSASSLAVYFPLTGATPPTPGEVEGLFDGATEWFRSSHPNSCLAVVAEPVGAVGSALEDLGFSRVVTSRTMLRSSAA